MRSRKIAFNSFGQIANQLATTIVGLILPQLMIRTYGSAQYGLVDSITGFLAYITLLESGVGAISRAALYKPLSEKNEDEISGVVKATEKFYRKLALTFLGYAVILAVVYPLFINTTFDWIFTGSLVLILAISSFVQYYFGTAYAVLLQADQLMYVSSFINMAATILNAVLSVIMIYEGFSIHMVKLGAMGLFALRPLCLNVYVRHRYHLNPAAPEKSIPVRQMSAGMVHNMAWFLHSNTDVAVLTIFQSLTSVAIYSVYQMPAKALKNITTSIMSGMEAGFGNLLVEEKEDSVRRRFDLYVLVNNSISVALFSTALVMIMPFIHIYTRHFTDADYISPAIGFFVLLAEMLYCMRHPYHDVVTAAGHFKQTQSSAIIEAALNIGLSIALAVTIGIPGVAFATVVAMAYRICYLAVYLHRNLIHYPLQYTVKKMLAALLQIVLILLVNRYISWMDIPNYFVWFGYAVLCLVSAVLIVAMLDFLLFREDTKAACGALSRIIRRKKR